MHIEHWKLIKHAERVTTTNIKGGVGLGFLLNGIVYKSSGSYWAKPADKDVFPMVSYERDGGQSYFKGAK